MKLTVCSDENNKRSYVIEDLTLVARTIANWAKEFNVYDNDRILFIITGEASIKTKVEYSVEGLPAIFGVIGYEKMPLCGDEEQKIDGM